MVLESLINLFRDLSIFAIAVGAFAYLARYTIDEYFEKRLQSYQTELNKEEKKFEDLHEKRAEVMAELYAKLTEFDEDMRSLVDPMLSRGETSRAEKIDIAAESGEELRRFYVKNQIYLPPEVCETMNELLSEYTDMFHQFSILKIHDRNEAAMDEINRIEQWQADWENLTEDEVPELKQELENQFRSLLGVDIEQTE